MQRLRGFTLIELMIAIALLGIIASLAAPSMANFAIRQRVSSQANELMLSLAFARAEAIKRNVQIRLLPVTNSAEGWQDGWCVGPTSMTSCTHADRLKVFEAKSDVSVSSDDFVGAPLTFNRDGTTYPRSGAFFITSPRLNATTDDARCINISQQGRPSLEPKTRDEGC